MIFKTLFKKKKWLSEKVSERLAAVAELSVEEAGNKAVLHELAFNDGDDKVRRATLDKLNDFSLWWQAYKADPSESIKKHSEKVIVSALVGEGSCDIDASLKRQFIEQCNKSTLLEKVLFKLGDESLIVDTLKRLDKEQLTLQAIAHDDLSLEVKSALLAEIDAEAVLKRLVKKLPEMLAQQAQTQLLTLQEAKEKPVKLEKQARLLLAQFNALKEKQSFVELQEKLTSYQNQWSELAQSFDILKPGVAEELTAKAASITQTLEKKLQPLEAEHLAQEQALQLQAQQDENYHSLNNQLLEIESQVTAAVAQEQEISQESIAKDINHVVQQANELALVEQQKSELLKQAESLFNRANKVPQIKAAIQSAKSLIEKLAEIPLPTDLPQLNQIRDGFKTLRNEWNDNEKSAGIALPADLLAQFSEVMSPLQSKVKELEKEQSQLFNQTRRKLSELENLVRQGRYHSAFGLFKKLSFWMQDLNDYQQNQLSRKWQTVEQDIAKLKDLEVSFSNPKKQELLNDIEQLAKEPLADATEQAHRVRLLRKNWQSLGHAGDDKETELNAKFDEFSELAFATCREHYRQLEQEREDNLKAKELILSQLQALADNLEQAEVSDWREVESLFVKLGKLWRETGLVDREKVDAVNKQYQSLSKSIKQKISQYHKNNEQLKRELIEKAERLVAQDLELNDTINQLKALQNDWQNIGFAGRNQDQKLWQAFRAVNNPVFEQRNSQMQESKAQQQTLFDELKQQFSAQETQLEQAESLAEYRAVIDATEAVLQDVKGLDKKLYDKLGKTQQAILKRAQSEIADLRQQQEKQVYVDLFEAVEALSNGETAQLQGLKPAWQNALNGSSKQARNEVTLKLEIIAGVESPKAEKALRNDIQMTMLSEKLEGGAQHELAELLEDWLAAGPFTESDQPLIERLKPIFI